MTHDIEIGVYHPNLMNKGGAEAVCMHLLEELCGKYDVYLITHKEPDFDELNNYFSTEVSNIMVKIPGIAHTPLNVISAISDRLLGINLGTIRASYLERCVRSKEQDYDLLISTLNERSFSTFSVHYVHYPREAVIGGNKLIDDIHKYLNKTISGRSKKDIENNLLICNSEWTYKKLSDYYSVSKEVIHPPVLTDKLKQKNWRKKEDGMVSIGRIEPSKNLVENIKIIDGVRDCGHETHLHIIGPVLDTKYFRKIKQLAESRPYIKIDGEVRRKELVKMIRDHKYGLHGKPAEHFGIVVAEIIAGGALPFVRPEGGQANIVNKQEELMYKNVDDGIDKIEQVITDRKKQKELIKAMPDVKKEYGADRFKNEFKKVVDKNIKKS